MEQRVTFGLYRSDRLSVLDELVVTSRERLCPVLCILHRMSEKLATEQGEFGSSDFTFRFLVDDGEKCA